MKVQGGTFSEAVRYLSGDTPATSPAARQTGREPAPSGPTGRAVADALALVADAERRLWTPEGAEALAYLHERGLSHATIRAARLGTVPPLDLPGRPRGVSIPWFDGGRLTLHKFRQAEGVKPKYRELHRDRPAIYPGRRAIRPGRPLVIVEG
jgi:DNA primase